MVFREHRKSSSRNAETTMSEKFLPQALNEHNVIPLLFFVVLYLLLLYVLLLFSLFFLLLLLLLLLLL